MTAAEIAELDLQDGNDKDRRRFRIQIDSRGTW